MKQTSMSGGLASSQQFEQLTYPGNLSHELLQVLLVEPRQMSSRDLFSYIRFLDENRLDAEVERLIFWQKMFAPVTIVIMCLLALPFVLGSQRQSNTGQRLLIGILLGLSFAVVDRVMTPLGVRIGADSFAIAMMPNLIVLRTGGLPARRQVRAGHRPAAVVPVYFGADRLITRVWLKRSCQVYGLNNRHQYPSPRHSRESKAQASLR